jgi:hypothetical protein
MMNYLTVSSVLRIIVIIYNGFSFQVQNFELGGSGFSFKVQNFEFGSSGFSFELLKYYHNLTISFVQKYQF